MQVLTGKSYPLGATVYPNGVNFSLFSKNATAVQLLLFDAADCTQPQEVIVLDPEIHKTFQYWHCFVPGIGHGQIYAYQVSGPYEPHNGLRFDGQKTLIDPYGLGVFTENYDRETAKHQGDNCAIAMKSIVVDPSLYDWEDDRQLNHTFERSVIYELHVSGFTSHPNSGVPEKERGTYLGLIHKIPYLKSLGVTAVELMPVQQFDPYDAPKDRLNYWGYSPVSFFAPHCGYATDGNPLTAIREFRDMVKAFHAAGIEIILDVVFNHTAEGDPFGPTFCFKGLENSAYYILENDKYYYKNYSGTGNSINANHSVVRRMIRDCLKYWVSELHVDGFRFDLASVLSRDGDGRVMDNPPLLWEIESDPVLASTKIIAEAWDIEQYQLGNFVGDRWAEWNGKYRDDTRSFLRGEKGYAGKMVQRILGSPDLFQIKGRNPNRSINFVTCHDGFTLNDSVSYNEKHNEDNGEFNRDGHNDNRSWNCGVEGPTTDPAVEKLRVQQIKNFFVGLLMAQGTPMLSMGDEVRRTQRGNNNAYCQDNELSWFDWSLVEQEQDLLRFVKELIQFNMTSEYLQEAFFWDGRKTTIQWHGTEPGLPDWGEDSHAIAFSLMNPDYDHVVYCAMNAYWEDLDFQLPPPDHAQGTCWHLLVNTAMESPNDIFSRNDALPLPHSAFEVKARSVAVMIGKMLE
jgi:glycogen operon protein